MVSQYTSWSPLITILTEYSDSTADLDCTSPSKFVRGVTSQSGAEETTPCEQTDDSPTDVGSMGIVEDVEVCTEVDIIGGYHTRDDTGVI